MTLYRMDLPTPSPQRKPIGASQGGTKRHTVRHGYDISNAEARARHIRMRRRTRRRSSSSQALGAFIVCCVVGLAVGGAGGGRTGNLTPVVVCGFIGAAMGTITALLIMASSSRTYRGGQEGFRADATSARRQRDDGDHDPRD
ncbi:MAG: hypothetical protein AB7K09_25725 [Planctomycetota bacterium]